MSNKTSPLIRLAASFAGAQFAGNTVTLALLCGAYATQEDGATLISFLGATALAAMFFSVPTVFLRAFNASTRTTMLLVGTLVNFALCSVLFALWKNSNYDSAYSNGLIAFFGLIVPMIGIARLTIYGSDLVLQKFDTELER